MELVDIINENKEVMHTADKDHAHTAGLLYKVVIAELIDSQENWTLVKIGSGRIDNFCFASTVGGPCTIYTP